METTLTDTALSMFDKLMGTLGRRAENRTAEKTLRSVRETQTQLRTLVAACRTVIDARDDGRDPFDALAKNIGSNKFNAIAAHAAAHAQPAHNGPHTHTRHPSSPHA